MKGAACRSCKAAIIWAVTENGKSIPVDAVALVDGGNILVDYTADPPIARVAKKNHPQSGPRHTSHFVTCPNAAMHRKAR